MPIKTKTYRNGLTLVYEKNKGLNSSIDIFIKVGSVNEPISLKGVSHFIEHMLFKGTKKLTKSVNITSPFDIRGSDLNAYTGKELTCYVTKSNSDDIEKLLSIFADMIFNSIIRTKDIKTEKQVVVEELLKNQDNPARFISENTYKLIFKGGNLSYLIGGTPESVVKYNRKDILDYYHTFYIPDNMIISICSSLSFNTIDRYVKKTFSKNVSKKKCNPYPSDYKIKFNKVKTLCINRNIKQVWITMGFRTCGIHNPDRYILSIISTILNGNMSSLLFIKLREQYGISYSSSIDTSFFQENGCFIIETAVKQDRVINSHTKGAVSIIIEILNKLITKGITNKQLANAKGYLKGQMSLELEDISSISQFNGYNFLFNCEDKHIALKNLYKKRYMPITKKKVNEVIRKFFTKDNLYSCFLGKNITKLKGKIQDELDNFCN